MIESLYSGNNRTEDTSLCGKGVFACPFDRKIKTVFFVLTGSIRISVLLFNKSLNWKLAFVSTLHFISIGSFNLLQHGRIPEIFPYAVCKRYYVKKKFLR